MLYPPVNIITIVLAFYASALSTYLAINAYRERWRRIHVTLTLGLMDSAPELKPTLILTAMNLGRRPVTLSGCDVLLPNRKRFATAGAFGSAKGLPCELTEGQTLAIYFPVMEVVAGLKREGLSGEFALRAVFRDALGNTYKSARFVGKVDEWDILAEKVLGTN